MKKYRTRTRIGDSGVPNGKYEYFAWGDYFTDWGKGLSAAEILAEWKKHRAAILARYVAELREKGPAWAGKRPQIYFDELEAKHPRRRVGTGKYWGPWANGGPPKEETRYPIYESDLAYLARLGLLEEWERALLPSAQSERAAPCRSRRMRNSDE